LTKEAFKEMFDLYFEEIRNYLFYRSGDPELSTDLAQDTFLKIWEKRKKIYPGNIKALLYKIASDLFVSHYRRSRMVNQSGFGLHLITEDLSPEELIQTEELRLNYEKALGELPENLRVVFLMSRMDNLKYHEIAERLGIGVKAVEKRMTGALKQLKKVLNV